ncbi:hypothetical protein [Mycolicibacterium moriokaense]|nr:hypothetical protein [Mycolicibacterium moriokaense]
MTRMGVGVARYVVASTLLAVGLAVAGCGGSGESSTTTVTETVSETGTSTSAAATAVPTTAGSDLPSMIPIPANSQRKDGPAWIYDGGVQKHFLVNGSPAEVMDAYKTALEDAGWTVVVENAGGGGGGGGATYTGTHGDAYGVFVGGGYESTTEINSCVWPTKPSNTNCGKNN